MQAFDVISFWRTLVTEPYQTRWTDAQALQFLSQTLADAQTKTRAFEGRIGIQTVPPNQEYPLPTPIPVAIKRVYMVGAGFVQRLTYTDISNLEGDQLRLYDQSGPNLTPKWLTLPPAPYPVANLQRGIGYSPLPMFPGQRPSWYLRGRGTLGVTVPPIAVYMLVLDTYPMPDEVQSTDEELPFDYTWKALLAWGMALFSYSSDQSIGSESLAEDAQKNYYTAIATKQGWVSDFNEDDPQGPQILTHRSFFAAGRIDSGGFGFGD